jgi:thioredoxin reductase (NADPH)
VDDIVIYGASWCPDCRRAKKFLADQRIPFVWHDLETEPDLGDEVRSRNGGNNVIPTIVFPDGSHLAEPSNEDLAEKLGIQRTAGMHVYDLVIVGGGPAGLTTAIYAARENIETLVIDSKGLGGQAGVTERLDNYPGFPEGIGGAELADRFVRQAQRYGVEMLQAVSVTRIADEGHRELDVETATGDHYHARAVLIATGSSYRRTGAEGEDDLIGAGVHFCATCDGPFYAGAEELMVIGGGNSGLEEGLFLTQFADKVTIVEYGDQLRGSKILQEKVTNHPRMEVLLRHSVRSFAKKGDGSGKLGSVTIEDRDTGELEEHQPEGAFVFIGLDPNTAFLEGSVELDQQGFVAADPMTFETSVPGVFAAGDVRAASVKQLAFAVGDGAATAIRIRGYLDELDRMEVMS